MHAAHAQAASTAAAKTAGRFARMGDDELDTLNLPTLIRALDVAARRVLRHEQHPVGKVERTARGEVAEVVRADVLGDGGGGPVRLTWGEQARAAIEAAVEDKAAAREPHSEIGWDDDEDADDGIWSNH